MHVLLTHHTVPVPKLNFDLFGSFALEFLEDELLTATNYLTEQTKTAETGGVATITVQREQKESRQLNDEDIDNFIAENTKKNTTKKTQSDLNRGKNC